MTAATIATAAGPLSYDVQGEGPPLVLLASAAHDRHDWDGVRPALAEHFRTVAIDWPAHGDSPAPPPGWSPSAPAFADLVEEVVEELDLGPAAFVGNSVGGFAAARLAIRRPAAVRALVLVDTGGFSGRSPATRAFCAAMGHPGFLRRVYPSFATRYMRCQNDDDRRILAAARTTATTPERLAVVAGLWASFAAPEHDLRTDAVAITAPTLVVWGTRDPVIPLRVGRAVAATIPGAELLPLEAGHVPYASRPDEFLAATIPFLQRSLRTV